MPEPPGANAIPIVNAALTRTGDEPITDFDEGTLQAKVAVTNYSELVNGLLSSYPWKFCSRQQQLAMIAVTPDPPWLFAYERPSDVLDLRDVEVAGLPITYEMLSDAILCNADGTTPVLAKYTYRLDEAFWPKYFRMAVIATLEPLFLRSIGERYDQASDREKAAARQQALARNRDAQSQTARNPVRSPLLAARRGFWPGTPGYDWRR